MRGRQGKKQPIRCKNSQKTNNMSNKRFFRGDSEFGTLTCEIPPEIQEQTNKPYWPMRADHDSSHLFCHIGFSLLMSSLNSNGVGLPTTKRTLQEKLKK